MAIDEKYFYGSHGFDLEKINHVKTQMVDWIPVSERLPEENGYYLTTTMYHEVYCDYWEENHFNRTETVIAWMPLPTPYIVKAELAKYESYCKKVIRIRADV
jgi:hypothetical protein